MSIVHLLFWYICYLQTIQRDDAFCLLIWNIFADGFISTNMWHTLYINAYILFIGLGTIFEIDRICTRADTNLDEKFSRE